MLQVLDQYSGSPENECHPAGSVFLSQLLRAASLTAPTSLASAVRMPMSPRALGEASANPPGDVDDSSQEASPENECQREVARAKESRRFCLREQNLVDRGEIIARHCEKTAQSCLDLAGLRSVRKPT